MRHRGRGSAALPAALVLVVVASVLAAGLADIGRTELVLARSRRVAADGLMLADACAAAVVAQLSAGWDFADALAGPDGVAGTPDDGAVDTPPGCSAAVLPGLAAPVLALLDVTARPVGGSRRLRAVVGRRPLPGAPSVVWAVDPTRLGPIPGTLALESVDPLDPITPPPAAIAGPVDPALIDAALALMPSVTVTAATPPAFAPPPPLDGLRMRLAAAGASPVLPIAPAPPPPAPPTITLVPGDLVVGVAGAAAGVLFVGGLLDIQADFSFNGVVVAAGGVRLASGAALAVSGALWLGAPAGRVLDLAGSAVVRHDRAAIDAADALVRLPRRAAVLGLEDR